MKEEWKTILTFPNYEVSDKGNIRNKETGHILSIQINPTGTKHVFLTYKGKIYSRALGKLIKNAFGKNPIAEARKERSLHYKCPNCQSRIHLINKKEHSKVCKPTRKKNVEYFEF